LGVNFSTENIFSILAIENHEFSKTKKEFLDKASNFYEFSKWNSLGHLKP